MRGSRIEVRLRTEMNLRAVKSDEAVSAALPPAGTESKPAVVGKGSIQVANRENRRYSRTHDCNLLCLRDGSEGTEPGGAAGRPGSGDQAEQCGEYQEDHEVRRGHYGVGDPLLAQR